MIPMQAAAAASSFTDSTGTAGPTTNVADGQESGAAAQQTQLSAPSLAQSQSGAPTGGQPGPQQATQGQMANTATPTDAKSTPDPVKCRLIQQELVLLLHANKCRRLESQANGEMRQCTLPGCKTMKNVLNHMTNCHAGKNCTVPHCSISRRIISHWKHCNRSDCPVCSPIKRFRKISAQAPAIQPNNQPNPSSSEMRRAYEALGIQYPITPELLLGQDLDGSSLWIRMAAFSMVGGPPGILSQTQTAPGQSVVFAGQQVVAPNVSLPLKSEPSTVGVAGNQTVSTTGPTFTDVAAAVDIQVILNGLEDLQLSSSPQPGQVTATLVQRTKEWHLSPDFRKNILHKLIRAIFPNSNSQFIHERIDNWDFAIRMEDDIYKMANSQSEYFHLLAEKICEIRKKHEKQNSRRNTATVAAASAGYDWSRRHLMENGLHFHKTQLTKMKSFTKL